MIRIMLFGKSWDNISKHLYKTFFTNLPSVIGFFICNNHNHTVKKFLRGNTLLPKLINDMKILYKILKSGHKQQKIKKDWEGPTQVLKK